MSDKSKSRQKFKPVKGYEGLYSVTKHGKVYSHERVYYSGGKSKASQNTGGRYKKEFKGSSYMHYRLSKNGVSKNIATHRIIAEAWIPNPLNLKEVNHKDANKLNNDFKNLEWVSRSGNTLHAYKAGIILGRKKQLI